MLHLMNVFLISKGIYKIDISKSRNDVSRELSSISDLLRRIDVDRDIIDDIDSFARDLRGSNES